jgi:glutamate formiminotransferase
VLVECVINISEGRDARLLSLLDASAGPLLLDRHSDPDHHRSVYTLVGPAPDVAAAARALATATVEALDLRAHQGAHPRFGVLDVVPFVPYEPGQPPPHDLRAVQGLRDDFARWLATELGVPSFLYGPLPGGGWRTLPDVRRGAFSSLLPYAGPDHPHDTAGACAVGARAVLVAYNVWVSSLAVARRVAPGLRSSSVRALGLAVGDRAQVSCNLVDPIHVGPEQLFDAVTARLATQGGAVLGAELVGLLPRAVLGSTEASRWAELGLADGLTVESRLEHNAVDR